MTPINPATRQVVIIREYEVGAKLGEGAFGAVYRARHTLERREYAMKVAPMTSADKAQSVRTELVVLSGLQHRNIVRYHTSFTVSERAARLHIARPPPRVLWLIYIAWRWCLGGSQQHQERSGLSVSVYLVMELGESDLASRIGTGRPLGLPDCHRLAADVLAGLHYLHDNPTGSGRPVIHRDLKVRERTRPLPSLRARQARAPRCPSPHPDAAYA